jgi:peptidyl-prolyl cis-trans isomerase C
VGKVDFTKRVLASVNGEKVLRKDFESRCSFFSKIDRSGIPYEQLAPQTLETFRYKVLENVIKEILVRQEAGKMHFEVPEDVIKERFLALKSQFGDKFSELLKHSGKRPEDIRKEIVQGMAVENWIKTSFPVNDSDLAAYFKTIKDSISVEQSRASHILITTGRDSSQLVKDSALSVITMLEKKIAGGANFAELAKRYSKCPSAADGGDLGFIEPGSMVPEFETTVNSLAVGQVSGVVTSRLGYHIIKVTDKQIKTPMFVQIKPAIERLLINKKMDDVCTELIKNSEIRYYN